MGRVEEAEQQVVNMEDWSAAAEEMICEALNIQDYIQATDRHDHGEKPTDINWIPERTEGKKCRRLLETL